MKNKKSLGQHWLKNRVILDKIAELAVADLGSETGDGKVGGAATELCLEIGPGLGTLTASLLKRFKKVMAIEYDEDLARNLPKSFPGKELEVVNADILQFDLGVIKEPYVVVGNIPYYITSPIIEKLLTAEKLPERIVLLIQKEVAERIAAKKGSLLALAVANRARVTLGPVVVKDEFTPPPKVDSQVIVLEPHSALVDGVVLSLIKRGFAAPRKKLVHNLMGLKSKMELEEVLVALGLNRNARPGDLKLEDWQKLHDVL